MKISEKDIRYLVPSHIYYRGVSYYELGRVRLIEIEPDHFKAVVSGSYEYSVEVDLEEDWFYARCNCPYQDDCKHIVAALLAAKDYYEREADETTNTKLPDWEKFIAEINRQQAAWNHEPPKWQLLYTLQFAPNGWSLAPLKSFIKKDGSLGSLRSLSYNDFFNGQLARTRDDSLALSFLERWQNGREAYHFHYRYGPGTCQFSYGEKVGFVLDLLCGSLVYKGHNLELEDRLIFHEKKGRVEFRLIGDGDQTRLQPYLIIGDRQFFINHRFRVLSSEPVWLLKDNVLMKVEALNNAACLIPFTRKEYKLRIPKDEVPRFLNNVTSHVDLFENLNLPEGTQTETLHEITEKRLYLEETEEGLRIKLKICYGDVEVDFHDTRLSLWGSATREDRFIKVIRDADAEGVAQKALLRTSVKINNEGDVVTRKNKALHWLMDEASDLIAQGFVLFGEENLKRYKVNRSSPQVRVAVESGIDWFDLNVEIDFGGILLSVKELRKSLQKRSRFVKLADGSTARIPQQWLKRFKHVLNLSDEQKDRLRLSHYHVTLIDELFAEASQKTFDQPYRDALKRLHTFDGIRKSVVPGSLRGELRNYQKAGFDWLHFLREFRFGGCLADDMGLGKTIQALALLLAEKQRGADLPSLIVTPTSVIFNWLDEFQRFAPSLRVFNQTGPDRDRTRKTYQNCDVVLTSYGTLRQDIVFLKDHEFNYVILDESQYIKNPISQTAKAAKLIRAQHRLALTGTPVENNTIELWSLFSFLNPGLLGNLNYFKGAFAKPIEQDRDQEVAELLRKMIFPFVLRRTKDEVEKDLPPKVENTIYCEMSSHQEKLYNQWRDYYRAALLKQIAELGLDRSRMNVLEGLMRLRQIACHPLLVEKSFAHKIGKYETLLEFLDELLAEGHKVLLFSQFVKMLSIIRKYLDSKRVPYEYLDGKTRDRKSCVARFQNDDDCKIFLISLRAGGTGLNLTAADYVIHYDPWWNPAVEAQATDRSHRIGQDKHVFVYKMITKGTVEEKILRLQERKKELVSNLITTDSGLFKHLTVEDITELFS